MNTDVWARLSDSTVVKAFRNAFPTTQGGDTFFAAKSGQNYPDLFLG
jgi:hypothetical protein